MAIIFIFLYFITLVLSYVFIMKRLRTLSLRHGKNTWIESLSRGYRIIRRRLLILLPLLFVLVSLVVLIFFPYELLFEIWLYNDKETLDNSDF